MWFVLMIICLCMMIGLLYLLLVVSLFGVLCYSGFIVIVLIVCSIGVGWFGLVSGVEWWVFLFSI